MASLQSFQKTIAHFYKEHARDLPWRHDPTPYRVVVSEIMLQQTQVSRVFKKFDPFIKRFPSFAALSKAPLSAVLSEWQGLGYNRRALNLHRLAKAVMTTHAGKLPQNYDDLLELPGIGPNTAGSILAFAFNVPLPFIETNIRSAYIHFFFSEVEKIEGKKACKKIRDDELSSFIQKTLAAAIKNGRFKENPREWYYALMDYGAYLKQTIPNPSRQSAHYVRQSKFEGSNRQLRSRILRFVMTGPKTLIEVEKECTDKKHTIDQVRKNTRDLEKEGFIVEENGTFQVK